MLNQYILPFSLAFILSLVFTPFVRRWAIKKKFFDLPSPRKVHGIPIPRLGGVAIFGSFLLIILGYLIFASDKLVFVSEKILGIDKNLFGVLLGAIILIGAGIYDDIKGLTPAKKFIFQILAAIIVAAFGIRIWWITNPFGGNIVLGAFSPIFVVLWILLMINVVNWLDGLDGLATGVSGIAATVLFFLCLNPTVSQPATALLCIVVAGAALGFLPFNFNPARIFLGDSGSMFLGFMLAVFAIISGGKVATAALVLGIPIFDAIWVILRRLFNKKAPWKADKKHLHHRFLIVGLGQKPAVLLLYFIAIVFGIISLYLGSLGKFWALIFLFGFMILLSLILIFLERLKNAKQNT